MKPKTYATAKAFRRALEDRLAVATGAENLGIQRARRHVAFDRLLVRLFAEQNPSWVLKGGYALELKFPIARTTKDIDLGLNRLPGRGYIWEERATVLLADLQEKAALDFSDFFSFRITGPVLELDAAPYGGARFHVEAVLDQRSFAKFHLDIAAGDVQREPIEPVQARDWLAFAGISAPLIRSIASEEHFAQKLHAYTRPRTERPNSRVKDLVDLVLLLEYARLDRERLKRDLIDTFAHRESHPLPVTLEPPPDLWRPAFARMAVECNLDPDITKQFERVRDFYAALLP